MKKKIVLLIILFLLTGCAKEKNPVTVTEKDYQDDFQISKIYPHNTESFTEGLIIEDNIIYESVGLYGKSNLYKLTKKQDLLGSHEWDKTIFAEGITIYQDYIYTLTYKERKAYRLKKDTLEVVEEYDYPKEGWGLTTDGKYLIASDGSSNIYFFTNDFNLKKTITVTENGKDVKNINDNIAITIIIIYFINKEHPELLNELFMIIEKAKNYIKNNTKDSYENIIKEIGI